MLGTDTTKWWIPLTYTTECELEFKKTMAKKWLSPKIDSITFKGPKSSGDWIIFNIDASGLYLVNYDEENWYLLIDYLKKPFFEKIPPLNRVHLIESAANLAWVGRLDYKIFFDMMKYLGQEKDFHPWNVGLHCINELNILLTRLPVHERFVDYVREILAEFFKDYGMSLLYEQDDSEIVVSLNNSNELNSVVCGEEGDDCMGPRMRRSTNLDILSS